MAAVIPAVTKLSNKIIRVLGCNPGPMTLQGTNTYIIGTGRKRILIDTGESGVSQYVNHLKNVLLSSNIHLTHILLSHWHNDHVGGVEDILRSVPKNTEHCKVWKFPREEDVKDLLNSTVKIYKLEDGQDFNVEGSTLRVIHTPGHTTDHVVFHLLEDDAIFSGDCILGEGTTVFEDLHDYMNSLRVIAQIRPKVIYPAHGNVINDPCEKIQFYIEHRLQREQQIMGVLKHNKQSDFSEKELVEKIYNDVPDRLIKAAEANVNHHLFKLLKEGKVLQIQNLWRYKEN